jgi:uncharacterized damage-inducible protein DinB
MHAFIEVWKRAKQARLALPVTGEEKYRSLDHLLQHVLGSSRKYLTRMYEHLGRPDPQIKPVPQTQDVAAEVDRYSAYLLDRWRTILAGVRDHDLEPEVYTPRMHYWIDAMLEHAVMHPIRHEFQPEEFLEQQ